MVHFLGGRLLAGQVAHLGGETAALRHLGQECTLDRGGLLVVQEVLLEPGGDVVALFQLLLLLRHLVLRHYLVYFGLVVLDTLVGQGVIAVFPPLLEGVEDVVHL